MTPATDALTADAGTGPADLMLVRRALDGDRAAVDGVLARLSCVVKFVYRLNRSLGYRLGSAQLEDVVQQVYLAVWPRLRDYAGSAALESWVFGFCRNCLRAEARKAAHRRRTEGALDDSGEGWQRPAGGPGPDELVQRAEGLDALHHELSKLPAPEREVVTMRHLDGWSFEQIASRTGLPASTVKDRCYRALTKLRGRMKRRMV